MAQPYASTPTGYQILNPARPTFRASKRDYLDTAYTIFAFTAALLLICLALRLILSLFVITGPIASGLTAVTAAPVAPFARIFPDAHEMVQVSTASAFTAYYFVYGLVAGVSRFVSRQRLTA